MEPRRACLRPSSDSLRLASGVERPAASHSHRGLTDPATMSVPADTIALPAERAPARREWVAFMRRLARRRTALFGLVVVAIVLGAAFGAPWLTAYDPTEQDIDRKSTRLNSSH